MSLSVIQRWVEELPLRMQSTLLLGLRGPDTHRCPNIKILTRWLRGLTFRPGNPYNVADFMFADLPPRIEEKSPIARELEFVTQHYYSHLMHSLEVVGYSHHNAEVKDYAYLLYQDLCSLFHLPVETYTEFTFRLRQMEWPEDANPETGLEAIELMRRHPEATSERDKKILEGEVP